MLKPFQYHQMNMQMLKNEWATRNAKVHLLRSVQVVLESTLKYKL